VVRRLAGRFEVVSLAARSRADDLAAQIEEFAPKRAVLTDERFFGKLKERVGAGGVKLACGGDALAELAADPSVDVVVSGIVGAAGLMPALAALRAGKLLALANKEPLVMAGEMMTKAAEESGALIIPVDSEHSAIFQALKSGRREEVARLILTASGGPFRSLSAAEQARVTRREALAHPTWSMGPKITVDSATMMNKALEIVEARWLFGVGFDRIAVMIHPQSIVHSIVQYVDGSMVAQMGVPDMRLPIQYALTYPERVAGGIPAPDLAKIGTLSFEEPDMERFPSIALGDEAGRAGGTAGAVLNGANEAAVEMFLAGRIGFRDIFERISGALAKHKVKKAPSIEEIFEADSWARATVAEGA